MHICKPETQGSQIMDAVNLIKYFSSIFDHGSIFFFNLQKPVNITQNKYSLGHFFPCHSLESALFKTASNSCQASVAQVAGHHPITKRCQVCFCQSTCLGCGSVLSQSTDERQPINVSLPLFLPSFPSL